MDDSFPAELPLQLEERSIAGRQFQLWLPEEPEAVLEMSISDQRTNPYWGIIWPAAERMAEFLLTHRTILQQPARNTALELGCGTGLVGLAALALGFHVTFNDLVRVSVDLAARNAQQNGFQDFDRSDFNWNDPPAKHFDLVIGSDLLYEKESHEALLKTLMATTHQDSEILIADMGRNNAIDFVSQLNQRDWVLKTFDRTANEIEPKLNQFQVFQLRRAAS